MDDAVDLGVCLEDLVERRLVCDICLVELGPLAADELNAVEGDLGGVVEIIYNHHLVAILEKGERGEGADVSGTTREPIISLEGLQLELLLKTARARPAGALDSSRSATKKAQNSPGDEHGSDRRHDVIGPLKRGGLGIIWTTKKRCSDHKQESRERSGQEQDAACARSWCSCTSTKGAGRERLC